MLKLIAYSLYQSIVELPVAQSFTSLVSMFTEYVINLFVVTNCLVITVSSS